MKTALFGGTFNPVHIGHLAIAEEVLCRTGCDRILFIPANIPPHKRVEDPGASVRLEMLRESIRHDIRFSVSDCEIAREGISYTIDTIRYLVAARIIEPLPYLILGDDLIKGFRSWKEHGSVEQESEILILHRVFKDRIDPGFRHRYIDNDLLPISSTRIRQRIAENQAWRYLVPDAVRKTIEDKRLYGFRG